MMEVNVLSKRPDTVNQELGALNIDNLSPIPHMVVREFPTLLTDPITQHHQQNGIHMDGETNNYRNHSGVRYTSSRFEGRSGRNSHSHYNNRIQANGYPGGDNRKFNGNNSVESFSAKPRPELSNGSILIGDEVENLTDSHFTISGKIDQSYQEFMSQLGHVAYQKPGKSTQYGSRHCVAE